MEGRNNMKHSKHSLAFLLALVLALLPVCSFAEVAYTGTGPITDAQGATVSILATNSWYSTVDLSDAPLLNEIANRANVTVDWNLIDPTIYSDTVSPMLAAGTDLPDILYMPDLDPNMTYLQSGMLVALDEYFDIMPNYAAFLDKNPSIKATLTAVDGHIYYVPQTAVTNNYQPVMMYNMEWLEQLGIDPPDTLDEFVEMLRLFRDNDMNGNGDTTDEIPMSIMADFLPYMFGPAFGLNFSGGTGFYPDENGVVHYAYYDSDKYKAYLTFLNGLYSEGLLEIEFTSLTRDQITQRFAQNLTGVTFDYSWQQSMLYSAQFPEYDGTEGIVVGAAPLSGEYEGFYVGRNPISGIFGVNSDASDIELAIKFLDYAMSEECQDLYVWGMEDLTYSVDANGNRSFLPRCNEDTIWFQSLGINAPSMPSHQSVPATDVLLPAWHVQSDRTNEEPYIKAPFPALYATEDEASIISMYLVDIETFVDEKEISFISGNTSLDTFDSYIETLKSMQIEELLAVRQAQYDRYVAAMAD
jgi:putative aldouronate transport system substrate-binding protein